jgi:hypothetical protein
LSLFSLPGDDNGLHQSQLIQWYLEEIEGDIDSEAELLEKKTMVEKVINRLVHHVSKYCLMKEDSLSGCFVVFFAGNLRISILTMITHRLA